MNKEILATIQQCVSKDTHRYHISAPYYIKEKNYLCATNGMQVFIYRPAENQFSNLETGYCKIAGDIIINSEMEGNFPNIEKVIPTLFEQNVFVFWNKNTQGEALGNILSEMPGLDVYLFLDMFKKIMKWNTKAHFFFSDSRQKAIVVSDFGFEKEINLELPWTWLFLQQPVSKSKY